MVWTHVENVGEKDYRIRLQENITGSRTTQIKKKGLGNALKEEESKAVRCFIIVEVQKNW